MMKRPSNSNGYYRLNLSGSETDVSTATTSNENLTQEERFVLRTSERQDPQGEEEEDLRRLNSPHPDKLRASTSGAFFDPRAVSLRNEGDSSSSDIISQLTREMRLYSRAALSGVPVPKKREVLLKKKPAPDNLVLLSRSQPDLSSAPPLPLSDPTNILSPPLITPTRENPVKEVATNTYESSAAMFTAAAEGLRSDNVRLKRELEEMTKKVAKVSQLEQEMSKIHESYQGLLKHSEKRETLEKNARSKLQSVIQTLSDANKEVTERHDAVMHQLMSCDVKNQNIPGLDAILRSEILRKDALISQLMNQNKMLMSSKERQDVEMNAQRETLEEQRQHIKILDSALSNAQANVLRLEEENRMKEGYAERVKQMTRSLEQLQAASEKREAMEKKLRAKLEEELKVFRSGPHHLPLAGEDGSDSPQGLRLKLSQAEEKIIRLESERTQWEQRYLEESAMRQVAIDAASIPKDAKIAALEKNTAESEKIIAEARSDKMRQFEEMQNTHRKCAELETLVKTLETQMVERDAMIRLIQTQQRSQEGSNQQITPAISSAVDIPHTILSGTPIASTSTPMHNVISLPTPSSSFSSVRAISAAPPLASPALIAHRHVKQLSTPLLASPLVSGAGLRLPPTSPVVSSGVPHKPFGADIIFKSGLNSRSLTPSDFLGRSITPTADMFRNTPTSISELRANVGRRDSMPGGDILALHHASRHSSPTPSYANTTTDLYTSSNIGDPSIISGNIGGLMGGTLPKMTVRTESSRAALSSGKFSNNPAFNILMDDSISSIVGSMTPTRIDSNPSVTAVVNSCSNGRGSPRHEPNNLPPSYETSSSAAASALVASITSATAADGSKASKSYMEVWNV